MCSNFCEGFLTCEGIFSITNIFLAVYPYYFCKRGFDDLNDIFESTAVKIRKNAFKMDQNNYVLEDKNSSKVSFVEYETSE